MSQRYDLKAIVNVFVFDRLPVRVRASTIASRRPSMIRQLQCWTTTPLGHL
jgi:hypothetical protein